MKCWQVIFLVLCLQQTLRNFSAQSFTLQDETLPSVQQVDISIDDTLMPAADSAENEVVDYVGRIVGGQTTEIQNFPYQVSLRLRSTHICGGAIISENIVLTAAHCVFYPIQVIYYSVRVGSNQHARLGQVVSVRRILRHANYEIQTNDKDIAMLVLANKLIFTEYVQAVSLPQPPNELVDGTELLVSGWGLTQPNANILSRLLRYVSVQLINRQICKNSYQNVLLITQNMICAGQPEGGKDSCQGDSGGPLVSVSADNVKVLHGIVSFGISCAMPKYPGVYTSVQALLPWIESNMKRYS